jgi:hypothetical protein
MMCDFKIVIRQGSKNLAQELNNYDWHDKRSGVAIDVLTTVLITYGSGLCITVTVTG